MTINPQLIPFGINDPPRKRSYYLVKSMFNSAIHMFYNDVEVVGLTKFPREGPVIVAINHSNSLTDAMVAITTCPRNVRLTCKLPLLNDPLYGWLIRGVEAIGVRRRRDYGGTAQDNTDAFKQLFEELSKGCCVGLFPEGMGRYQSHMSPLKTGLARTAVDFVIQQQTLHKPKYNYLNIVPVGITYLHREMFRSSVCVRIGDPIKITPGLLLQIGLSKLPKPPSNIFDESDFQSDDDDNDDITASALAAASATQQSSQNIVDDKECFNAAQNITETLGDRLSQAVISAPSWHMICIAHLARTIAFPESGSPRHGWHIAHYVDLTRQFAKIFTHHQCDKHFHSEEDTKIESDESMESRLPTNTKLARLTFKKLESYWQVLLSIGLKENRIAQMSRFLGDKQSLPPSSLPLKKSMLKMYRFKLSVLGRMCLRAAAVIVLWCLSAPGVILTLPISVAWRLIKRHTISLGIGGFYDKTAQAKILVGYFGTPLLAFFYAFLILLKSRSLKMAMLFLVCFPIVFLATIRAGEEGMSCARSCLSLWKMFWLSQNTCHRLVELRTQMHNYMSTFVSKFGVSVNESLVDPIDAQRSGIAFNRQNRLFRMLLRRSKSDWNETLRFYDLPADRFHLSGIASD